MRYGVIVFLGSNCDQDVYYGLRSVMGEEVGMIWHGEEGELGKYDCIILPGGFSYGDYLRVGALAGWTRVMRGLRRYIDGGGLVLGICNGFQILLDIGVLEGSFVRNKGLRFMCKGVDLRVRNEGTMVTQGFRLGDMMRLPVANGYGSYYCDLREYERLVEGNRIVYEYCEDINGSTGRIAGVCNLEGNVVGMMPHPERALEGFIDGGFDGVRVFESIRSYHGSCSEKGRFK